MNSRPELKLDWCSYAAAKYAVEHWHYSRRMPLPPLVSLGVWENQFFIGSVVFGRGANCFLGRRWGLSIFEVAELVRIAFRSHDTPISRIIAIAVRLIRAKEKRLRMLVSFADTVQGHHGGIYQAAGWFYIGKSQGSIEWFVDGRWKHNREVTAGAFKGPRLRKHMVGGLLKRQTAGKLTYVMPIDSTMRARILPLAQPYPKRAGSIAANAPAIPAGEGGAAPTPALHQPPL